MVGLTIILATLQLEVIHSGVFTHAHDSRDGTTFTWDSLRTKIVTLVFHARTYIEFFTTDLAQNMASYSYGIFFLDRKS